MKTALSALLLFEGLYVNEIQRRAVRISDGVDYRFLFVGAEWFHTNTSSSKNSVKLTPSPSQGF